MIPSRTHFSVSSRRASGSMWWVHTTDRDKYGGKSVSRNDSCGESSTRLVDIRRTPLRRREEMNFRESPHVVLLLIYFGVGIAFLLFLLLLIESIVL
jgi:hypothetical protein